ncbi:phage major capsid protein [Bifidobacterium simiarum]|uniref:phage major capsid protein n=1 Tax=Bifidobacterium simiarum TaxID=2045441 RepID=UPI001BDCDA7A|nr:phage major capsid protein [Bifidobacterium simiarum]MBT1167012.1 phage major capsid protein [Bifidobacterium simiarum]
MPVNTSSARDIYEASWFQPEAIIPTALIMTLTTIAGRIEGDAPTLNVPYIGTEAAAQLVREGDEIPDGGISVSELHVATRKVAALAAVTNEANYSDDMRTMLGTGLAGSVVKKADAVFLQNPAPAANESGVTGLFNLPDVVQAGTIDNANTGLDPIVDGIAAIATNGGTPTHIIMGYGTWAALLKLKTAQGLSQISPDVANAPVPQLFGLPVILSAQAPADAIMVTCQTELISAVGQVSAASSDQRYFERDSTLMRSTFRFGYGVIHADRLAKITVTLNYTDTTK